MSKSKLYIHILLDRSGSMQSCRDSTIDAFNEYVSALASDKDSSTRISLTLFDSVSIDLIHDACKAKDFPKLDAEVFVPRGGTPLLDAIGSTVTKIDEMTLRKGEKVALVVLTDGRENSSKEFKKADIKAMLDDRQDKKNWLVVYLGANQDAFAEGGMIGMRSMNTMTYDTKNVAEGMRASARRTQTYVTTGSIDKGGFTDDERRKSV